MMLPGEEMSKPVKKFITTRKMTMKDDPEWTKQNLS